MLALLAKIFYIIEADCTMRNIIEDLISKTFKILININIINIIDST